VAKQTRQLPLPLPHEPRLDQESFVVGESNGAAYAYLARWPDWPDRTLLLVGPEGSGKTHLASIWADRAGAARLDARQLHSAMETGLAEGAALLIEDVDAGALDETALFHLSNSVVEHRGHLVLTARRPLAQWGLGLADLASRLRRAPVVAIAPPDDEVLRNLIAKHFNDRQVLVEPGLVDYLARRLERSFAAVQAAVAAIDAEALASGRNITRAVARRVLALAEEADTDDEG
jgi:chromosomal replication initiation ATPase DnaA